jgi:selenium donor protein
MLAEVIDGGRTVASLAGAVVAGGHSVDDPEPKYGMCVTGVVHPGQVFKNSAAKSGDRLVLTKPIGTGILSSALKAGLIDDASLVEQMVDSMVQLNNEAALAAHKAGCRAVTDVSGFGLLGHLTEMLRASGCAAELYVDQVPLLPGLKHFAEMGVLPGGSRRNLEWVEPSLNRGATDDITIAVLADAQTSGGLLICWPDEAPEPPGPVIGVVTEGSAGFISLK